MQQSLCIVLGISGGIAAYKAPSLIRLLTKEGCSVKAVCTEHAMPLVGIEALRTVSGHPVFTDRGGEFDLDHIELAQWADYLLIAPATANIIAKIAHGIADNLLSTLALSFHKRLIIAPAMNTAMWNNPVTVENVARCRALGCVVLDVGEGELACGTTGAGRMMDLQDIVAAVMGQKVLKVFAGKKVLISMGATEESIDPVRVITNRSSGKMGHALAEAALQMGAIVTVVCGQAKVDPPHGVTLRRVETADQMSEQLSDEFSDTDVCIMAAAVADFKPVFVSGSKIHREDTSNVSIELTANPDILAGLGARKTHQFLVGFSLGTGDDIEKAALKLSRKQCDLMIANQVNTSLGLDSTQLTIVFKDRSPRTLPVMVKSEAAREVLLCIASELGLSHE